MSNTPARWHDVLVARQPAAPRAALLWVLLCALWLAQFGIMTAILPPSRDVANFLVVGSEQQQGARLYTGIWDNKPPAVFVVYRYIAAATDLTGLLASNAVPTIGAGLFVVGAFVALFWQWRRATPNVIWMALALAAVAVFARAMDYWALGQAETLALLPLVLCFACLQRYHTQPSAALLVAAGLAGGLLPLIKPQFVLCLLPLAVWWPRRRGHGLLLLAALAFPTVLTLLLLAGSGSLPDAYDAVVRFNLRYSESGIGPAGFVMALWQQQPLTALLLTALGGAALVLLIRPRGADERAAALWWLGSVAAVAVAGRYWYYHWLIVIPALLALLRVLWLRAATIGTGAVHLLCTALAVLVAAAGAVSHLAAYRALDSVDAAYRELRLLDTIPENRLNSYTLARYGKAAAQLRALAQPGERLQVFGYDGTIYLLSGLRPATRFFYDFPLHALPADDALSRKLRAQFMADVQRTPPDWVVVECGEMNPVERQPSEAQLAAWPEAQEWLQVHYDEVAGAQGAGEEHPGVLYRLWRRAR